MAPRKKKETEQKSKKPQSNAYIAGAGTVVESLVTETLKSNFMPYAMSVIISRAIPEIDGFKPSHRKLLYTMYNMGVLKGNTIKSANIVGRTMQLNPHGDAAIYETMVRLSEGTKRYCILMLNLKVRLVKHIHAICSVRLHVIPRQSWLP